jgi:hypothetical protein
MRTTRATSVSQRMSFPGFPGIATALGLLAVIWLIVSLTTGKNPAVFDPGGKHGEFGKGLLPMYLDIAKFVLGLAAGSIILLVGSLNLNQSNARPLRSFASPLFMVVYEHHLWSTFHDFPGYSIMSSICIIPSRVRILDSSTRETNPSDSVRSPVSV